MADRLLISSKTRRRPQGEAGPGKNAMLPCTTAAFTSTGKPDDFVVLCQLVVPYRPSMRFLSIGSRVCLAPLALRAAYGRRCALRFHSPSLPSPGWFVLHGGAPPCKIPASHPFPELASDGSFFIFMSGFPTRDLHPIYITPMLGTHKPAHPTAGNVLLCIRAFLPAVDGLYVVRRAKQGASDLVEVQI